VHLTHPLLSNGCELQRLVFPEFGNYDGIVWVVLNRLNTWTRVLHRFVNWSPPLLRNTGSVSPSTSDCKNMRMIPVRAQRIKKMNTPIVIRWEIKRRSGENLTPVHLHCAFRVHVRKLQILCCHFDRLIRRVANVELKLHVAGRGIYQGRLTMSFFRDMHWVAEIIFGGGKLLMLTLYTRRWDWFYLDLTILLPLSSVMPVKFSWWGLSILVPARPVSWCLPGKNTRSVRTLVDADMPMGKECSAPHFPRFLH